MVRIRFPSAESASELGFCEGGSAGQATYRDSPPRYAPKSPK
jgi:hypothetical protein